MRRALILFLVAAAGCRAVPPGGTPAREPGRGFTVAPYEGRFAEYPAVADTASRLSDLVKEAEATLRARLGASPDPERLRRIALRDDVDLIEIETKVEGSRRVQEIGLPAVRLAQGTREPSSLVLEAVCRAALTDQAVRALPAWYVDGAPAWVSGALQRMTFEALLGGPRVKTDASRVAAELPWQGGRGDLLAAGLFVRFLAEEFGAEKVRDLFEALRRADSVERGLAAALETDAESLPVAYDSYRLRVLSEITDDRIVRELAAAQARPARDRATRLSDLSTRTANPWVAAAVLEELGLALFETGDFEGAAGVLARVERDHASRALHLDRDRLHLALCFARRGEAEPAALRLDAFLAEFPRSGLRPAAQFELAALLLELGRAEDAMARYRELAAEPGGAAFAEKAHLVLAAYERGRYRYEAARRHLLAVKSNPEAGKALTEIDAELSGGLPEIARKLVEEALDALDSGDPEAAETLAGVGPAAGGLVLARLAAGAGPIARRGILDATARWPRGEAEEILLKLLADEDPEVAAGAVEALLALGVTPSELRRLLDSHPAPVPHADAEWGRRFGAAPEAPEVAGRARSGDAVARREAAKELAGVPGPEAFAALVELSADRAAPVRCAAIASLAGRPEGEAAEAVRAGLDDDDWTVRLATVDALYSRRDLAAIRGVVRDDGDSRVRLEAARFLLASGDANDLPGIVAMLTDADGTLATAIESLLRGPEGRAALPAAAEALRDATEPGAAMRMVRVIARHVGSDFGYDPTGGGAERARVAAEVSAWLAANPRGE